MSKAAAGDERDLAPEDVDKAGENERVRDERRGAQLGEITHEHEGQKYDELDENEVLHRDVLGALRYAEDECLQVLSHEDRVCAHKTHLRHHD